VRRVRAVLVVLPLFLVGGSCTSSEVGPGTRDGRTATRTIADTGSHAGETATEPPTAATGPSGDPAPVTTVTLDQPRRDSLLVEGRYPLVESPCVDYSRGTLTARYPGEVTVSLADDGSLTLTAAMSFEDYLKGIAEVPPSWPMAALEAQAIAARSYALASTGWTGDGETLDDPICSTSSCQVYRGIPLDPSSDQKRWDRAVRETRGEILVDDGRPATTFYFSTSNGRTYGNEDVFGGDPLPYLRPVTEDDDGASGLSHWRSSVRFEDLARFLDAAGSWPASTPVDGVSVDGETATITGGGQTRSIAESDLRDAVNTWASCLVPSRYPPSGMPTTIPSRWVSYATRGSKLVATGRGWGHGVGMVQWGAYGKARLGWSATEIVSFYYGGFEPEPFPEPGVIEVQLADGLESMTITPSGPGATVDGEAFERRWLKIRGGDELSVKSRGPAPG
jgi:stage II sporulation protein D